MDKLATIGLSNIKHIYKNLPVPRLVEESLKRGEGF